MNEINEEKIYLLYALNGVNPNQASIIKWRGQTKLTMTKDLADYHVVIMRCRARAFSFYVTQEGEILHVL